jgi:tetratricopeptide (TPR) repeat protein
VGLAACKECHVGRYESYLHTAHSRALTTADPAAEPPDGAFEHPLSGRSYRVYRQGDQLRHEEAVRTPDSKEVVRLDLPVRFLVGSGSFARTYLVENDGFLSESPITWYAQKKSWGISPGYDRPGHYSFQRPVTAECLTCHAGRVESRDGTGRSVITERPIGCESCHGPGSLHAEYQRTTRHPPGSDDLTIVNPAKLPRPLLESVCAVCHLQGAAATVLVRGRTINTFRPGRPLSDYRIDYTFAAQGGAMTVVGHFEQLRRSACYRKSEDLSCLTCHDPHLREKPKDPAAYYRRKCLNCHAQGCALPSAERLKKDPRDDCTACHMPRGDTEVPHVAFTHHCISRHATSPPEPAGLPDLVPIDDAPQLTDLDRNRNLGLAYLMAAIRSSNLEHATAYGGRARELLEGVQEAGLRDGATLEGLATIYAQSHDHSRAGSFARDALAAEDLSEEGQTRALQILLEGHVFAERVAEVIAVLEKLTRRRRFAEDWRLLGACYLERNQPRQALPAFERALAINPFRPAIHAGLAEVYRRLRNLPRAREHEEKARSLPQ